MPVSAGGIDYAVAGSGDRLILCLQGIGGGSGSFADQMEPLSRHGRVVAWNMPGYGGSAPLPGVTFGRLSDAVIALADDLGAERIDLVGQSIGGMIALETAIRAPARVRSLTLIATTPAFGGRDPAFADAFLKARLAPLDAGQTMPELARAFVPEITGPIADARAVSEATVTMAAVPADTYRAIIACLVTFNRRDDLGAVTMPSLVIAGSHDRNAPERTMKKMATALPDARFHVIEGAGHLVNSEAPAATNTLIDSFLEETA